MYLWVNEHDIESNAHTQINQEKKKENEQQQQRNENKNRIKQ